MAWTGYITTDKDSPNVGTATAVWNEGEADEFRYSRRARMTAAGGDGRSSGLPSSRDSQGSGGCLTERNVY